MDSPQAVVSALDTLRTRDEWLTDALKIMEATDDHQINALPYELREWWHGRKIEDRTRCANLVTKMIVRLRDQISIDELEALDRLIEFATGAEK